jgi:molybdopterin synthase sulfur carrier subunit
MASVLHIQLFGRLGRLLECQELVQPHVATVDDLRKALLESYPLLRDQPFVIAVNQEVSRENCHIPIGAEIALLPPYSGG